MVAATALHATAALLLLLSLPAALADANFVSRTCNATANPGACRSLLDTDPSSRNATTVAELVRIGLIDVGSTARDVAGAMAELAGEGRYAGTAAGDALALCTRAYGKAMHDLDAARGQIVDEPYGDPSRFVSREDDPGDACEKAFAGRGVRSAVRDLNQRMTEQWGVAADLALLIKKGGH